MTDDDAPTIEEALNRVETIRNLEESSFESVEEASEQIDGARSAAHDIKEHAEEAIRQVEEIESVAESMRGEGVGPSTMDLNAAFDTLHEPYETLNGGMDEFLDDIEGALRAAENGDTGRVGRLEIGGKTYEMTLTRVDDDEGGFGEWLNRRIAENEELDRMTVFENSLVSDSRLGKILEGEEPSGDEGPSIVKMLEENGFISEAEAADVRATYFADDEGGDEGEEDTLEDLF